MKDRLIELLQNVPADYEGKLNVGVIADYLIDNGVIAPPCKVGDVVYDIFHPHIQEWEVSDIIIEKAGMYAKLSCKSSYARIGVSANLFGRKVFLTREEAEEAMKERKNHDE